MNPAETIQIRVDMLNGSFDLDPETLAFMKLSRETIAAAADTLNKARPQNANVGRFIAAIDHLQQTKNLFCDAVILGNEEENRKLAKKRKAETSTTS